MAYDDEFDLYSRAPVLGPEEEEENPFLLSPRISIAEPPPVLEPKLEEEEPPAPPGYVPFEEPPAPEGYVSVPEEPEPSAPEGYVDVDAPKGDMLEAAYRVKRNARMALEEHAAGAKQAASYLLSAEQNPYVEKSVAQAKADIPLLEQQIAEGEKNLITLGGKPEFVGQEWSLGADLPPEQRELSQKLAGLQKQLGYAKEGATGKTTESYAGALSRTFAEKAEENRAAKEELIKEYGSVISKAHDKDLWMQVADSIGSSIPSMFASMGNPAFGLALMYSQTFETSRAEFLEKGGDPAKADEYGNAQAMLQTPWEIFGDVALAGIAKDTIKRLVGKADPKAWSSWIKDRAVDLTKSTLGEREITTPAQTMIEQKIGEEYGVKPQKSWEELQADVAKAKDIATAQSLLLGGGPVAVEAAQRAVILNQPAPVAPGTIVPPVVPPVEAAAAVPSAGAVPPVVPPGAPASDERFAPPPYIEAPGTLPGEQPGVVTFGPGVPPVEGAIPPVAPAVVPPTVEVGPRTPEGDAVTQVVGKQNAGVTQVASEKAETLQASGAPKTAEAIQQVARASNAEASVSAADYLQQAKQQAAEAAAEAAEAAASAEAPAVAPPITAPAPAAPAVAPPVTGEERFAPPPVAAPPVQAVPAPAAQVPQPVAAPPAAVVVGGQVFTGATHEDAARAAYGAVGGDAMGSAQTGWVDPDTGRFVSHDIYYAHQALNTAMEQTGGNPEHPAVQQAGAQLAEAQARDTEINTQIVQPGGEQVIATGVKGQEAVVSVRPSQELATPLAGVNVSVGWTDTQGRTVTAQRPAAQALNDARNDKTGLTILLNCLT